MSGQIYASCVPVARATEVPLSHAACEHELRGMFSVALAAEVMIHTARMAFTVSRRPRPTYNFDRLSTFPRFKKKGNVSFAFLCDRGSSILNVHDPGGGTYGTWDGATPTYWRRCFNIRAPPTHPRQKSRLLSHPPLWSCYPSPRAKTPLEPTARTFSGDDYLEFVWNDYCGS